MKEMDTEARIEIFDKTMMEFVSVEFHDWLTEHGFFTAPASTKYHGNYEGGLFDHSFAVTNILVELSARNDLKWQRKESPFIVGMFHDLCKIDQYRHPVIGEALGGDKLYDTYHWEYDPNTYLKGHGDKSVMMLATHYQLTEEEVMCIRYHMGAFTDKEEWRDYTRAVHKFPNVLWVHHADMIASHIIGM